MISARRLIDRLVRGVLLTLAVGVTVLIATRWVILPPDDTVGNVAHAGGRIGGLDYTNSIAALDASYRRGFRLFEIDFDRTADGLLVCAHDWNAFGQAAPDFSELERWRAGLEHPPCLLSELADWFAVHPDALLISDPKIDPTVLNGELLAIFGGRLIAQAYSAGEVCTLLDAGVRQVYLTVYRLPPSLRALGQQLTDPCMEKAAALVMPWQRTLFGHGLFARLAGAPPVYVHTVNSRSGFHVSRLLGADAVYTDILEPGLLVRSAP